MNILLVVDGSFYSELSARMLEALRLPAKAEVTIMTVVPEAAFLGGISLNAIMGTNEARKKAKDEQQQQAIELLQDMANILNKGRSKVEIMVRWGNPVEKILEVAEEVKASLIVMGARGLTDHLSFRLGSVAQKVMKYASASVLLVRPKITRLSQDAYRKSAAGYWGRVLIATDGSRHSDVVTKLLLALPLPHRTEIIILTALQSHLEAWMKTPTLDFRTNQDLLAKLHKAEESEAWKITEKVEKQFQEKHYKTESVVVRGGAGECILSTVKDYNPDIVAVGSKGLTGIESYLLGSVAERVARYANCSVLIGRNLK